MYLSRLNRQRFADTVRSTGAHWISYEGTAVIAEVERRLPEPPGRDCSRSPKTGILLLSRHRTGRASTGFSAPVSKIALTMEGHQWNRSRMLLMTWPGP